MKIKVSSDSMIFFEKKAGALPFIKEEIEITT
jgi:hypothetical protein